ncbi:MAG: M28 family peptidase, partial [Planctomycetota bacterium]
GRKTGEEVKDPGTLVTEESIRRHMEKLASDEMEGRLAGEKGCQKAEKYVEEQFKKAGLKPPPGKNSHMQTFEFRQRSRRGMGAIGRGGKKAANVLGYFAGSDSRLKKEVVVLGGHIDHCGKAGDKSDPGRMGGPMGDDGIWNGANDNASGVTALLAIADALGTRKIKPKRSILLIAFAAEEHGLLGSRYYCSKPLIPLARTYAAINMDSIGRLKDNGGKQLEVFNIRTSAAWKGLIEPISGELGLTCTWHDGPWPRGMSSDHVSFSKQGVPSLGLFTGVVPERHKPNDHAELIDYKGMTTITRLALKLAVVLANRKEKLPK